MDRADGSVVSELLLKLAWEGEWQVPLRIWRTMLGKAMLLVGLSQHNVARALAEHGTPL